MSDLPNGEEPPRKRVKLDESSDTKANNSFALTSLERPISPPLRRAQVSVEGPENALSMPHVSSALLRPTAIASPFQLTTIQDLPIQLNANTVTLKDLLSDPLISECWEFNYLHDLDMLMETFDPDIRKLVKVHVVHGFWKQEDGVGLKIQASRHSNVTLHTAYMPEPFGTHHTKMMVLLRHDDLAQIIIHTANLIQRDWANLSQAVWRSPLLPLTSSKPNLAAKNPPVGSGLRFKIDFLNYLRAYDTKRTICKPLIEQLVKYDFSEIRGALVASVPGRHHIESNAETKWGWQALQHILASVPTRKGGKPEVVVQISSIATLGQTNAWLENTLFKSLRISKTQGSPTPSFKMIFPTADEVRRSLDGYQAGASIHMKIQTAAQTKQLQYLQPILHYWAGDGAKKSVSTAVDPLHGVTTGTRPEDGAKSSSLKIRDAGRRRAAPHIKTYVRFADNLKTEIDWALVTSANISKQAWGEACNSSGEVRISSYELGVLVWPGLYGDHAKMVPTFKQDMPSSESPDGVSDENHTGLTNVVVGFRMPYDLPLVPYPAGEKPWCATASYNEPDWRGSTWP